MAPQSSEEETATEFGGRIGARVQFVDEKLSKSEGRKGRQRPDLKKGARV
jgi:hypothetical protein